MLALAASEPTAIASASALVSLLVMLLALALAGMAIASLRRRGNPAMRYVAAAFGVFALKNGFSAYNVVAHERAGWPAVQHDAIELVLSLFDLVLLLLLFVPLILRRRA